MPVLDYLNFDLEITAVGDGYRTRVLDSPVGEVEGTFVVPFTDEALEIFVLRVGRTRVGVRRVGSPQQRAAEAFGTQLFDALLNGELRSTFGRSMDAADNAGKGLRVRLRLTDAPALSDIPWEYMYWSGQRRFLVLSAYTPLVRYIDLPRRIRPLTVTAPLRILLVVAGPRDLPALDVEREEANTRAALEPLVEAGLVEVVTLAQATLPQLRRTLRSSDFHVLHFVGHGGYDESLDGGVLAFENDAGYRELVSGDVLATLLCDHPSLRLALLNACEGARSSRTDPFAGVAQSLVCQGIPAVIGMQFEFTDAAALTFSSEFYLALLDGYPVDAALAEARRAVLSGGNDVEWGTPVLYLRSPDGRIFDVQQRPTPEVRAQVHEVDPTPPTAEVVVELPETNPADLATSLDVPPAAAESSTDRPPGPLVATAAPADSPPARSRTRSPWWQEKRTVLVAAIAAVLLIAGTITTIALNSDSTTSGGSAGGAPASSSSSGSVASTEQVHLTASRGTPTVDGNDTEWGGVPEFVVNQNVTNSEGCDGASRWQLMWDDAGLYFIVYDGVVPKPWDGDPTALYKGGDSIGFQLGHDAESLSGTDPLRPTDRQFQFGTAPDGQPLVVMTTPQNGSLSLQAPATGVEFVGAGTAAENDHHVEGFVPWTLLSLGAGQAVAEAVLASNLYTTTGPETGGLSRCIYSRTPAFGEELTKFPHQWDQITLKA